ncbi:MAG: sigma-70 family RNA polymerase sigma factor [Planctomycetes bacterium]|nr:sigma-70 family RNA polymerase sigma factor [Planctomycetota bacterium]
MKANNAPKKSVALDDAAWLHSVVEQYESSLVRYAARLLGDVEQARDVAQDTFLRLCREPREKVENRVRQWLFAVCRNRAMDVLKKENRMKALSDERAERCTSRDGDHAVALERKETASRATAILENLPENQREVIRLKVQNGLSYREISDVTGLSVSNVGFLLHKGIKTIRERLAYGTGL